MYPPKKAQMTREPRKKNENAPAISYLTVFENNFKSLILQSVTSNGTLKVIF